MMAKQTLHSTHFIIQLASSRTPQFTNGNVLLTIKHN